MCGIAGFILTGQAKADCLNDINVMLSEIDFRGPDGIGYYCSATCCLGNARLSLIDTDGGKQPFSSDDGRYWICYNGEVHNYEKLKQKLSDEGWVFRTRSDTEVILSAYQAWGTAAFSMFNGGFALVIFDRVAQRWICARDQHGKRPFYYFKKDNGLIFGSTIQSVLSHSQVASNWSTDALTQLITMWTTLPHQTCWQGVLQLPPGHFLELDENAFSLRPYAGNLFNSIDIGTPPSFQEAKIECRRLIEKAVSSRLIADSPVGVYLSGGLDSSIITAIAAKQYKGLQTFSVKFFDSSYDESEYQVEVANAFCTLHNELLVSRESIVDAFPVALGFAETPQFRSAFVPMYLLSKFARDSGVKSVLVGEGADEYFIGYDIFKEAFLVDAWGLLDSAERESSVASLYPYLKNSSLFPILYRDIDQRASLNGMLSSHALRFKNGEFSCRILSNTTKCKDVLVRYLSLICPKFDQLSAIKRSQMAEINTLLHGYLLSSQGDRMAYANGLELRAPFLDLDVVKFALNLPEDFCLPDVNREKYILREVFANDLPADILARPKQPYRAPDANDFLVQSPEYLEVLFSGSELKKVDVLDSVFLDSFVKNLKTKDFSRIGERESQTFMFALSIALLDRQINDRNASARAPRLVPEVQVLDYV